MSNLGQEILEDVDSARGRSLRQDPGLGDPGPALGQQLESVLVTPGNSGPDQSEASIVNVDQSEGWILPDLLWSSLGSVLQQQRHQVSVAQAAVNTQHGACLR